MWKSRQWFLNDDGWWQLDSCAGRVLVTKVSGEEGVTRNARQSNGGYRKRELGERGKIIGVGEGLGKNGGLLGRLRKTLTRC